MLLDALVSKGMNVIATSQWGLLQAQNLQTIAFSKARPGGCFVQSVSPLVAKLALGSMIF